MKIRWFYDRYTRSYIALVLDENNYEVCCEYSGNKVSHEYTLNYLARQYNTDDIRKFHTGEKLSDM